MNASDDRRYRADFYAAVDQRQGLDLRQGKYYVPIYERPEMAKHDVVATLRDAIDFTPGQSVQLLSGFRGSGKTSELLRLREELSGSGYVVAYMDIEDFFNTELPMDLGALPVALAAGFARSLRQPEQRERVTQRLIAFLRKVRITPKLTVNAGDMASLELAASLREDASFRAEVTKAMQTNRLSFRQELHTFFRESVAALEADRGVVFLVDSIDHFRGRLETFHQVRDSVERAFSELADDLLLPTMHVVYTVPIYVKSPLAIRHDILNIKVADQADADFVAGIDALHEVLSRRAPAGDLARLTGGGAQRLVRQSGGLFRDLLRLTGQVLLNARVLPADEDAYARAEMAVRNDYEMTLSREHVEMLRQVARTHEFVPATAQWPDAYDLIASGAVLRYPNGEHAWYGVHPLLAPLL